MPYKKIKNNVIIVCKRNYLIVSILFFVIIVILLYQSFFVKKWYSFWPNVGLDNLAISINKNNPHLFLAIGNSYFGQGRVYDIQKAERAYINAIKFNPNLFEPHYQLGRIYFIRGEFASSLIEVDKTLAIDSEFKHAYYLRGLVYGYQGDLDNASIGFEEFIKRDNVNWAGYNDLAWVYFKKGDYAKVKEIAGKGLERGAGSPWLNNMYGTALMNLGEKEEAKKYFEIALQIAEMMSPEDWGKSYPGNNPVIYQQGLEETKSVIQHNLRLVSGEGEIN